MGTKKIIPLALPEGLAIEIDKLIEKGEFVSRNEALKFGARLVVMMLSRTHQRAEDYAYQEIKDGVMRGKKANVS